MPTVAKFARTAFAFAVAVVLGVVGAVLWFPRAGQRAKLAAKVEALNKQLLEGLDATSRLVTLSATGVSLHVVSAGDPAAPLVVLLHGFPDCWVAWRQIIPGLTSAGYRVVAPDLRGYNLSDRPSGGKHYRVAVLAEDIRALIVAEGAKDACVVGHDWGGIVAWELAQRHPDLVRRLFIINSPHPAVFGRVLKTWDQRLKSWYMFLFKIPGLSEALILWDSAKFVKGVFRTKRKGAVPKLELELLGAAINQPGVLAAMLSYYRQMHHAPSPRPITSPTFVLWGERDVALTKACAAVDDTVESATVEFLPNVSHWVPYEVPDVVVDRCTKFFGDK